MPESFSRRKFLRSVVVQAAPVAILQLPFPKLNAESGRPVLEPTPGENLALTPEETAGPFFRPHSPSKKNFREPQVPGQPIQLSGHVVDEMGKPIAGALMDFWHADGNGEYDLQGFRCRGHQFTASDGYYVLETVVPGLYPGRTRHFHVRLQRAYGPVLSTQLYFPREERNKTDFLFRSELVMDLRETNRTGSAAFFNFVLAA